MTNRLHNPLRTISFCVGLCLFLFSPFSNEAQSSFFNFSYNGPDTLSVGVNCNKALQGNIPNPVVSSTIGATITTSQFDAASSGFPFNQLFTPGETAHVFWFVADNMGHSYSFEFFIFFKDNTPPVFDLTGVPATITYNSIVQVPPPPNIPISDNCTSFTQSFAQTMPPDTCEAGVFTRTWQATDLAGNTAVFTQTITILADNTPPTITFPPQNGSAACELLATAYPAWLSAQMAAFTAQDPSGIKSLTNNGPASYPPGCKAPITVTFKATDNCNLMLTSTAVFTTSDTNPPVVVTPPQNTIAYCSPGGNHLNLLHAWIHAHGYMQVIDSCSGPIAYSMMVNGNNADSAAVVAAFNASFANSCGTKMIGTQMVNNVSAMVTVDFLVMDACGNPAPGVQAVFAAVDTLPPVLSGVNITEQCGGGNDQSSLQAWINAKGNATLVDDCSTATWTDFSFSTSNGQTGMGTFNAGPYPTIVANNCTWFTDVTFHASDECGNASAITLRFQIIDDQPPVFTGLAPNITVYCPNPLPTTPAATITDNCDLTPTITFTRIFKDSICDGSYTVATTWKATDDCGNSSTVLQNIFVRDTTRPVFNLVPPGLLLSCDNFVLPPVPVQGVDINATDLCSPVVSITTVTTNNQNPNPALCSHYSYHFDRVFTATDECGNTRTATQLITVIDNHPPIPGGVLDTTALCSALTPLPAPPPTAIDVCSGPTNPPVYVNTETVPGGCAGQYTLKLNWIATDFCGNQAAFVQTIHVVDTVAPHLSNIPPDITVECNAIPAPPATTTFNGVDNCASNVVVSLTETEFRNPDLSSCDHWTNYTLRREWTATDDCGNSRKYTQNIQIQDTTPPALVAPPTITLPNDMGDCGAEIPIPAPLSVTDICTSLSSTVLLKDTLAMTAINGTAPVDSMFFHFSTPNLPPNQPATSNVSLSVFLDRADANDPMEFFRIFGENGVFLGNTSLSPSQCSTTPSTTILSITPEQFNEWASDGDLEITLAPNFSNGSSINLVCPNSVVRMHLGYSYTTQQAPIAITYSLDGAPFVPYPPSGTDFLPIGTHTIVYTATDCAGNSATASTLVVVNDAQPPAIQMPAPITTYASATNCNVSVTLPFPVITENCEMSGHLKKSSAFMPLSFIEDPDAGMVPADVNLGISGLFPNAIHNGKLIIKFKGENANPREFFNIFQNATQITTTNHGSIAGQCQDTVLTTLTVTPAEINAWAATGTAIFRAEANKDAGPSFDFNFINPCGPLLPNQTDGISKIQAMLEYSYAIVNFTITRNSNAMIVATGALQGNNTMVNLTPGVYTVKYTTTDNAGLMGMTTFPLVVLDTVDPVAKCKPSWIINVNPSGVNNYTLLPSEINAGSMDNCSGTNLMLSVSPNTFTCNQAGNNITVVMTVKDTSGNVSTCSTIISVQNAAPMPFADPVCEGDTLRLYANPPTPGLFTYLWTGPSFSSTDPNPIRYTALPSYQGLYTVKITGAGSGCMATGAVNVNFASLTVPQFTISGGNGVNFCQGQNVGLNTQTFPGNGVVYQWYLDQPGGPTLIGTSSLPFYTVVQPPPGQYHYFVKIKVGDCLTPNSVVITVNVYARPIAAVDDDKIILCEGQPLAFGTSITGSGLTYAWSGPLGWTGSVQYPLVTTAVTMGHAGFYTLTTYQNGCASIPSATIEVDVKHTPPKPFITGNTQVCVGADVTLTANVTGAVGSYEWQSPTFGVDTIVSGSPTLVLHNISLLDCGNWRVRANLGNCFSEWSDLIGVCPQEYPVVSASSNGPICKDSVLNLMATASLSGLSWCWTLPDNNQVFVQNPTIMPGQSGNYQVIAKTSFGCADTAKLMVFISIAPVIDSIIVNAPVCADGSNAFLVSYVTGPNAPFTYSWKNNGVEISTAPTLSFGSVTPANNGNFTLVVKDDFGCPSLPATAVLDVRAMVSTPVLAIAPNPICEGGEVTLSVTPATGTYAQSSMFHWLTPTGVPISSSDPQLVFTGVTTDKSGVYKIFVSDGVCQSDTSNAVSLVVNPIPPTPIAGSNQPLCVGNNLQLTSSTILGATYSWSGPNGFSSPLQNPTRTAVSANDEGSYTVTATVNMCTSAPGSVFVDVLTPPKTPVIKPPNPMDNSAPLPVCLEQPITATLSLTQLSQTLNAVYTWLEPVSGDTIFGPSTSPILNLNNLPAAYLTPGLHSFQVVAWLDNMPPNAVGCNSSLSNIVSIRFDTIPNTFAQADPDHQACATATIPVVLNATTPPSGVFGQWSLVSGPSTVINDPNAAHTNFPALANNTYTFAWTLSSGGCLNFSTDQIVITTSAPDSANAGDDIRICDAANLSLNATQGANSFGVWSQLNQPNIVIADSLEPHTPVSGLIPGVSYVFYWTLPDIGCGASTDAVTVYYYSSKPIITGEDFVCNVEGCANLLTSGIQSWETGVWTSKSGTVQFSDPNLPQTRACGLAPGDNEVYWTINQSKCGANSRDTFVVKYDKFPVAVADEQNVDYGNSATVSVLDNDELPLGAFTIDIITPPISGSIIGSPSTGKYVYRAATGFSGIDVMTYRICNPNCGPTACSTAAVRFMVGSAGECLPPGIITPNGDGTNEDFIVPAACFGAGEGGDSVELTIFNQWGDKVFHKENYLDEWHGQYNGKDLPAGTYYYVLKFKGNPKALTGFVLIQR